jgi:arylsulfatase A-like enzyme
MRVLYIDIDTLRPDHLGCYGYHRSTSPNIDSIAEGAVRFDNCYVSDAPCLPSRASMFLGQFGIRSGVVGHGGTAADARIEGRERGFSTHGYRPGLVSAIVRQKLHTVSFSSFAERHSAFWFYAGWREMYNCGKGGGEDAKEVVPGAIDWINRNAKRDDWFLHVHVWDPHTPYRVGPEFGEPFKDQPLAGWYTEDMRRRQWQGWGLGSPQEPCGGHGRMQDRPRQPAQIKSMDDYKKHIDGYDTGILYADMWVGRLLEALAAQNVLDDTAIIVTSDHGELQGELNVIGDHATADHVTSRVPLIVRWPGVSPRADAGLYYQNDFGATMVELLGGQAPKHWDGRSFAAAMRKGQSDGRSHLVVSQNCWSCQRAVRWGDYMLIRSYHTGLKNYPARMLFNVAKDPHELNDLAPSQPALADHGQAMIEQWASDMMTVSASQIDPLWTVMREGGPVHTRDQQTVDYIKRLRDTGRAAAADFLEKHPRGFA